MSVEFVDTNVLLYAYDLDSAEKRSRSRQLLKGLDDARAGALSTQVLIEFYNGATKKLRIDAATVATIMADYGLWSVHRPSVNDLVEASGLHVRCSISWWDALIVQSAMALGCTTLWTEDLAHGHTYGPVTVRNPFL